MSLTEVRKLGRWKQYFRQQATLPQTSASKKMMDFVDNGRPAEAFTKPSLSRTVSMLLYSMPSGLDSAVSPLSIRKHAYWGTIPVQETNQKFSCLQRQLLHRQWKSSGLWVGGFTANALQRVEWIELLMWLCPCLLIVMATELGVGVKLYNSQEVRQAKWYFIMIRAKTIIFIISSVDLSVTEI